MPLILVVCATKNQFEFVNFFKSKAEFLQHFILNLLQWPAMATTLLSAWLVASEIKQKRCIGFWFFLISNVLWIIWGWHDGAYALIVMQFGLLFLNIRGVLNNKNTK